MTSTAMSRRQRRGVANHSARRSVRRTITVIISVLITIALFAGYCIADVYDVMPGMLTLKPVDAPTFADPVSAKQGGTIAGSLDTTKTIDAAAAGEVMNELLGLKAWALMFRWWSRMPGALSPPSTSQARRANPHPL